jgi:diguanylate cyclase (GGDEF)-like protein
VSLFKQIEFFVTALLLIILVIILNINFNNTREFSENQLYVDAKNTANTLSLSLSSMTGDVALMETAINAMFDGGYFEEIALIKTDGENIYTKQQQVKIEGVPKVFIDFVKIKAPAAESNIIASWNIFGILRIKAHTGHYYLRLWNDFKGMCLWFTVVGVIALVFSHFILKYILGSLFLIKKQADAISENEFIINQKIPKTIETRQIVLAMNSMVSKVQNIYNREIETLNKYQTLRFKDKHTGLYNRKYFRHQLNSFIESDDERSSGNILLISLENIEDAYENMDYQQKNSLYNKLGNVISKTAEKSPSIICACLNKKEFGIIIPLSNTKLCLNISQELSKKISEVFSRLLYGTENETFVAIGIVQYTYDMTIKTILSNADYALSVAKRQPDENIYIFPEAKIAPLPGRQEWKKMIENALDKNLLILSYQRVMSEENELHREIYTAMVDSKKRIQKCGFFMPMVIQLNLAIQLDKYVLTKAINHLKSHKNVNLAINLTNDFLKDRASFIWFRQFLIAAKKYNNRLMFEIPDNTVIQYKDICVDFAGLVKGLEFNLGIDNFILNNASLSYLKKLKPNYIKIDQGYLLDKDEDSKNNDAAIKSLQTITDSLDIVLIVSRIETEKQKETLKSKNITHFQGCAVSDILPMETNNG